MKQSELNALKQGDKIISVNGNELTFIAIHKNSVIAMDGPDTPISFLIKHALENWTIKQEPKKLYAYIYHDGEIRHYKYEDFIMSHCKRAPEYDITLKGLINE